MARIVPGQGNAEKAGNEVHNAGDTDTSAKVKVRLFGSIRQAAGNDGGEVYPGIDCTVYELLRLLSENYGGAFRDEILKPDGIGLREDVILSVNGVIAEHAKLKSLILEDGAAVDLLPAFPGGG